MLHLVLVRHGESIRNYLSDLAREGQTEPLATHMIECPEEALWPLTVLGFRQSAVAGEFIRNEIGPKFERSFVSPFVRARQTADALGLDVEWTVDSRLRERLWGDYPTAHYTVDEYVTDLGHCSEPTWRASFPNSESISDLEPEAASFVDDQARYGRIIAVTHGGTMAAFERVIERNPRHRPLGNCGVLEYELESAAHGWIGRARFACPAFGDKQFSEWEDFV